jgi:hypothetical protein
MRCCQKKKVISLAKAAGRVHCEIFKKLWDWAKDLQLKPEELRNEVLLSNARIRKLPGKRQQKGAILEY